MIEALPPPPSDAPQYLRELPASSSPDTLREESIFLVRHRPDLRTIRGDSGVYVYGGMDASARDFVSNLVGGGDQTLNTPASWRDPLSDVLSRVRQLADNVSVLSTRVAALSALYRAVSAFEIRSEPDGSPPEALFFDGLASGQVASDDNSVSLAREELGNGDFLVRAAAARALSALLGREAVSVLQERLAIETDRDVRITLRASIRSASL